jgi:hypothetical protein
MQLSDETAERQKKVGLDRLLLNYYWLFFRDWSRQGTTSLLRPPGLHLLTASGLIPLHKLQVRSNSLVGDIN